MVLDLVVVHVNEKEMENSTLSVDEMVDFILSKIHTLDPRRRYMFIEWLCAHTSRVKCVINLRAGLNMWFDTLPAENTNWEYHLITNEIDWWQRQDDNVLDRLILDHLRRRS